MGVNGGRLRRVGLGANWVLMVDGGEITLPLGWTLAHSG